MLSREAHPMKITIETTTRFPWFTLQVSAPPMAGPSYRKDEEFVDVPCRGGGTTRVPKRASVRLDERGCLISAGWSNR